MKFGVLGILCRLFVAYFTAKQLNVNLSKLIFLIREEDSNYLLPIGHIKLRGFYSEGFLLHLVLGQVV